MLCLCCSSGGDGALTYVCEEILSCVCVVVVVVMAHSPKSVRRVSVVFVL